jgi:hypothetical protein
MTTVEPKEIVISHINSRKQKQLGISTINLEQRTLKKVIRREMKKSRNYMRLKPVVMIVSLLPLL